MNKFYYLFASLLFAVCGVVQANGAVVNDTDHYSCGFETVDDYNQWTKIDLNGVDGNGQSDVWWDEDWKAANFNAGMSQANDEWLISPAVNLTGGKGYTLKVKFYCDYPGKMAFYMGQANTAQGMTVEVSPTAEYGDSQTQELTFDVPASLAAGKWYIGAHCTTDGYGGPVYLQNVELVKGAAPKDADYYYCGFNTQDEYNTWTHVDVNGLDDNNNNTVWWDSDWKAAQFNPGTSMANDEWLISPAVNLTGGSNYAVKVKFYCDYPGKMAFYMGQGTTAAAMTKEISATQDYGEQQTFTLRLPVPGEVAAGAWNFGVHCTTGVWDGPVYLQSFEVVNVADVDYTGTILESETQQPVEGVTVKLASDTYDEQERTTGADGKFTFSGLTPGVYNITMSKDGFEPLAQEITVSDSQVSGSFSLVQKSIANVYGKLVDEAGNALAGLTISLKGDASYEATTADDGTFRFEGVQRKVAYAMTVQRNWKQDYNETLNVQDAETNLGNVVMKTLVASPQNLSADVVDAGTLVSWMMPVRNKEFAHDNGVYGGTYQFTGGDYNMVGNVFSEPAVLTGAKWLLSNDGGAAETADLYVYALNADGSISDNILYQEKNVPNKNYTSGQEVVWNEHSFNTPVVAPHGYLLAVGCNGAVSVCADYTKAGHSVVMQQGAFRQSNVSVFFIRGVGSALASTPQPAKVGASAAADVRCTPKSAPMHAMQPTDEQAPSYNIYRLKASDKANRNAWTAVENGFKTMSYFDREFNSLAAGTYVYAVEAVYAGGKTAEAAFSNEVDNNMFAEVKAHVYTNTAVDFSDGAVVTLVNEADNSTTYTAVAKNGYADFAKVRKGFYTVNIVKNGFEDFTAANNNFSAEPYYEAGFELQLVPKKPFNLQVENADKGGVVLTWNKDNGIFDDFEGMPDFAINPQGELGWTYADVDGVATYGVAQCQADPYKNMYMAMAFQAFTPSATNPSLLNVVQPHSGDKMLVDVALADGSQNDDYIFSPELDFDDDVTLDFYAASGFYATYGNEEFMVGYTTGEAAPENVTWITKTPQQVGALWTNFSYVLPKEARHAVIRCVSNQRMFFMLDDVFVGQKEPETSALATFNVNLDGEDLGNTSRRSYSLGTLDDGKHIAKVQTVYSMFDDTKRYSDFAELVFRVNGGTGIGSVASEVLYSFEHGVLTLGANADNAALYDVQGRKVGECLGGGTISTMGCQPGVYVLKVQAEGRTSVNKIMVR